MNHSDTNDTTGKRCCGCHREFTADETAQDINGWLWHAECYEAVQAEQGAGNEQPEANVQQERAEAMAKWVKSFGFEANVTVTGDVRVSLSTRRVTTTEVRRECHFNDDLKITRYGKAVIIHMS